MKQSIAVIGAGLCGGVCANRLAARGHAVKVFDKGRGPGGRMSSRRTPAGHRFDHGTPWFDVTRPELHDALSPIVAAGVLTRSGDRYFSPGGANALCKWLLDGIPVEYGTKIVRVEYGAAWTIFDDAGVAHGPFDAVVLAVPPVNAAEAVGGYDAALAETIASIRMLPRWVVMLAFAERLANVPDEMSIDGHVLRRSLSNTTGDAFVVQAAADWSVEHVEQDASVVAQTLHDLFRSTLAGATPLSIAAHRWRYAFADEPLGRPFLTSDHGLVVCGDWCLGHGVESAWLSATAAVATLTED